MTCVWHVFLTCVWHVFDMYGGNVVRHLVRCCILFAFAWHVTCALLFACQWASDDTRFHWDCNLPGNCRYVVLHFDICPGALPCVDKAMCSHHILQITTVDSLLRMQNTTFNRIRGLIRVKKAFDWSFSCHAWSFSVMDVVGHWGCNSPGDCKFIVLHFYMSPGVLPCVAKK